MRVRGNLRAGAERISANTLRSTAPFVLGAAVDTAVTAGTVGALSVKVAANCAASSPQASTPHVRSMKALLIASGSFAALLAMLALASFVRSARFLLDPPSIGLSWRGPPLAVGVAARAHGKARRRPSLPLGAAPFDWQKGWSTLHRFGRITPGRAAQATRRNSRLVRHYLPRVAFYAMAVVLSFAIGAWIAVYLQ